jgi:peptidoglycan hydrolase-like protein with peptidoglycan-binding domain
MTLYTGDILFTGKLGNPVSGHTVIVVSGKTRSKSEVALYNLRKGSVGDEVLKLQKNLNALGYKDDNRKPLVEDGDFGSKTEQALKKFQKSAGIKIDGVYNKEDYNVMKYAINHK